MNNTHAVGNVGEARIIFEAVKRGYIVCVPRGHDTRYDLVVDIEGKLCKVQIKTTNSNGEIVKVKTRSIGKFEGNTIAKRYTEKEIDWIAVYDITTDRCAFIPAAELGDGLYEMTLRFVPPKNHQVLNVRWFSDYERWEM